MNCSSCHECEAKCVDSKCGCVECGKRGMVVAFDTVLALSNDYLRNTLEEDKYFLCTNPLCDVAYYSAKGRMIKATDIKTDIWFKKQKAKYIVCYCRDISLNDVIQAVNNIDNATIDKVISFLNKEDIVPDCLHHNPTSITCERLFNNAIEYAKKIREMKEIVK